MSDTSNDVKEYTFHYKALGRVWGLDIPARSPEEAKHRVAAISSTAEYQGRIAARIPVGPAPRATGWFAATICWLRNRITRLA